LIARKKLFEQQVDFTGTCTTILPKHRLTVSNKDWWRQTMRDHQAALKPGLTTIISTDRRRGGRAIGLCGQHHQVGRRCNGDQITQIHPILRAVFRAGTISREIKREMRNAPLRVGRRLQNSPGEPVERTN